MLQAGDESGLSLLRLPSVQGKAQAAQRPAVGTPPAGPPEGQGLTSSANLARDPVTIQGKSASLREQSPVSRAQLLGSLGHAGRNDSTKTDKNSLSLKDLPLETRQKLAESQAANSGNEAGGSNNSNRLLGRRPLSAKDSSPVVAERSFSF